MSEPITLTQTKYQLSSFVLTRIFT